MRDINNLKHVLLLVVLHKIIALYLNVPLGHLLVAVVDQKHLFLDCILSRLDEVQDAERPRTLILPVRMIGVREI